MSHPDDEKPRDAEADDVLDEELEAAEGESGDAEPEWVRRQRLDAVFGKGVEGRGEQHGGGKGDSWYRDQTPPHHG